MSEQISSQAVPGNTLRPSGADLAKVYDNPYPLFKELRQNAPILEGDVLAWFDLPSQAGYVPGRPIYTLLRYRDVMAVLRDAETFTSGIIKESFGGTLGEEVITGMDGEPHKNLRGLLAPCFSRNVINVWSERFIAPVIREEFVHPLAARPEKRAELAADLVQFPMRVIYEILGFPNDPQQIRQFAEWGVQVKEAMKRNPDEAPLRASQKLYEYILPIVARKRALGSDGDDLIAQLLRATYEGHALDDDAITRFVRMLVTAAVETTTISFRNMMTLLLQRPQVLERVRKDRSLVLRAIDETIRLETPASFHARQASRDAVIGGVLIPAGAALSLAAGSANHDETIFEDGESYNIDRPARPALGFGFGPHMCIGQHTARAELAAALNAILDLMPNIRVDPDNRAPTIRGVIKRGPEAIHVVWD